MKITLSTSFTHLLKTSYFNSSLLAPGQHMSIGGPASGAANAQSVTTRRIVLRHEGHAGQWVVGSTNTGNGSFSFNSDGLAGVLFHGPITVYTTPITQYLGGLSGLSDLSGSSAISIRVVGLVLKNPTTQQPVFVARSVEGVAVILRSAHVDGHFWYIQRGGRSHDELSPRRDG